MLDVSRFVQGDSNGLERHDRIKGAYNARSILVDFVVIFAQQKVVGTGSMVGPHCFTKELLAKWIGIFICQ